MRLRLLATLLAVGMAGTLSAQTQPLLQLQGQPYSGGSMKLHLSGTVGQPALLAYGLNPLPLDQPLYTGKGAWYVGSLVNLVSLGAIPSGGRIDLAFAMPPISPALTGIPIVMQGYVPFALSNSATLPLDEAYYVPAAALVLTSPQPQAGAKFGDRVATGDLNGDGAVDIVVGAWFEDYGGFDFAGRAYIFWGPSFTSTLVLDPPSPYPAGEFGDGVAVADFDGDGLVDLMVGEASGYPFSSVGPGYLYFYSGGPGFSPTPRLTITSAVAGLNADIFGRIHTEGDLNGDGFIDIAIGLPNATVGPLSLAGRIHVFWGPSFDTYTELVSPEPEANANFGSALAIGDVDGDGLANLIEGSGRDDVGSSENVGSVHVYTGPALSLSNTISNPLGLVAFSYFGDGLGTADLDQDGLADVAASDEFDHVFVFWSGTASNYSLIKKPPSGSNPLGAFGFHLEAGDVNGDGRPDLVIGNAFEGVLPCSGSKGGMAHVALGPYFESFHTVIDKNPACGNEFAWCFKTEDLDGDGVGELIAGSPTADDGGVQNGGHLTIFYSH
jgi:hypothetical protein